MAIVFKRLTGDRCCFEDLLPKLVAGQEVRVIGKQSKEDENPLRKNKRRRVDLIIRR